MNDYETVAAISRATTLETIQQAVTANEGRLKVISEMEGLILASSSFTEVRPIKKLCLTIRDSRRQC